MKDVNVSTEETVIPESVKEETVQETKKKNIKKQIKHNRKLDPAAANYPEHFVNIALIIKSNAEIRRFTSIGIINYLLQTGQIAGEGRYVSYKWNKFAVSCNGLIREYSYTEPFFLNALVASFTSFSHVAQTAIDTFCRKTMKLGIDKGVDKSEVENIIESNKNYINEEQEEIDSDK